MERPQFLLLLDELLELNPGTLRGEEPLDDLSAWNSLALIGFMAVVNEQFGVVASPKKIAECKTVSDLVTLALPG